MPRADLGGITKTSQMRRGIVAASALAIIATGPIISGSPSSAASAQAEPDPTSTTAQFAAITADLQSPYFGPVTPARKGFGTNPALLQLDERRQQAASRSATRAAPAVALRTATIRTAVSRTVETGYIARHAAAKPARTVVHANVHHTAVRRPNHTVVHRTVAHKAARTVRKTVRRVAAPRGLGAVVAFARAHVGHSYGGNWDCSGFVKQAYARIGINLPHSSYAIAGRARSVSRSAARPGDLIVGHGHVGIYMGGGMMIDAGNPRVGVSYRRMYAGLWLERLV